MLKAQPRRQDTQERRPSAQAPSPTRSDSQDDSERMLSNTVASGTPVLDVAELRQVANELPTQTPAVGGTLLLLSLIDLELVNYIPGVGIAPIIAGGILDVWDRGTTYAELDDGVGIALTTIRGVNGTIGDVIDNVGTGASIVQGVATVLAFPGWGALTPVGAAVAPVAAQVAHVCSTLALGAEACEGSLGMIQLCWDAYQSSRAAADGQQARAEVYAHMALDDALDVFDAALSAALLLVSMSSVGFVPSLVIKGVVHGSAFAAYGPGQREELHHSMVGSNYTEDSRTPRGSAAWALLAEDAGDWWEDGGAERVGEEAPQQAPGEQAPDGGALEEAIREELQRRWAEFLEGFDVSAWLSGLDVGSASALQGAVGPRLLADGVDAAGASLLAPVEALLAELQTSAVGTMGALAEALEAHREDLERIQTGHALLDTMAGEVQGLLGHRAMVREQLTSLLDHLDGVPGAQGARAQVQVALSTQLAVLDSQISALEERIARERAILDVALGAGGLVETMLQAALDRTAGQLRAAEEALASFQGLEIDLPGTVAWLYEVAAALLGRRSMGL